MSRRAEIRMTDDEVAAFLAAGRILHVATVNPDGAPHLMPVFYVVFEGRVAFWTYTRSQKIRNLERNPRLTVMLEDGDAYGELRGVQINGRARLSTDAEDLQDIGERLYARYFGVLDSASREGVAWSARKRTRVVVEPVKVVSWDHRRLGGAY